MKRNVVGIVGLAWLSLSCTPMGALGGGGGGGGGGSAGGEGLDSTCANADYGTGVAAQKLETFLLSTATFISTAADLERTLIAGCTRMATDLGIPEAELQATSPETPALRATCDRVSRQIREEMAAVRGAANVQVQMNVTPPVCQASVDAYAQCAGQCDATYTPGQVPQCEGGELRGTCSAQCTGRCSVEAHGSCSGRCEGTCSASCTGVCQGTCEGTCSARASDGSCNGRCQGTCRGSCSAGCTGSCEGSCEMSAQAQCSGECRGGCSVAYTEPRCTGRLVPPQVDADCRASCDARVSAQASCTPGHASMVVTGGMNAELQARADRLRTALQNGLPAIQAAAEKLRRLRAAAETMVNSGAAASGAVAELGLQAAACATQATAALPRATASVSVSVEVSASVSASASGG